MKAAVIYISLTGNTEKMARAIFEGTNAAGADSALISVGDAVVQNALEYDVLILGSPAMGAEVLEEESFEPFFSELEKHLAGKRLALFGSYGWGDGQWMRDWEARCKAAGARLVEESLIVHETPDVTDLEKCKAFGSNAVK